MNIKKIVVALIFVFSIIISSLHIQASTNTTNQACTSNLDCNSGNCYNGYCQPPEPVGMACINDGNCQSNICNNGFCQCSSSPTQVNCPCSNNDDCQSGICIAGLCET